MASAPNGCTKPWDKITTFYCVININLPFKANISMILAESKNVQSFINSLTDDTPIKCHPFCLQDVRTVKDL